MAYRNLNLAATLKFKTEGFKSGLSTAMRQLEGFRRSFLNVAGALGASIGVGGIVSALKNTATQLSVAQATLKNTSLNLREYGETTEWLNKLANDYKQSIIVLTDSFAKFHAASQGTNFTMEEQKELYKGLVQAATYYHMSSERTENMLVAVEQMMSKGKITAEELRRQLGNNLPGAYAKVAQAAIEYGKTTEGAAYAGIKNFADFETAMKKGAIGVDVLLQFVRQLDKETKNIDTNSLQLAANEMQNAWTKLVESSGVENAIKRVYSLMSGTFDFVRKNLEWLIPAVGTSLAGMALGRLSQAIVNVVKEAEGLKWGTWLGVAITLVSSLVAWWVKLGNEIRSTSRELRKIGKIEDDSKRLASLQKTYNETNARVRQRQTSPSWMEGYAKFKKRQPLLENLSAFGGVVGLPAYTQANKEYFQYEEDIKTLPEIKKQIDDILKKMPVGPDDPDFVGPVDDLIGPVFDPNKVIKNPYGTTPDTTTGKTKTTKAEKDVADYVKDYQEAVKKLNNQLNANSKTSDEAIEEGYKLATTAWENITAFDNFREKLSALPEDLKNSAANAELFAGVAQNLADIAKEGSEGAKNAKKWEDYYNDEKEANKDFKARSTRFDWEKKDFEILRAEAEQWEDISERINKKIENLSSQFDESDAEAVKLMADLNAAMDEAVKHATNLKDAADVSEWQDKIKELTNEYKEGMYGGIKEAATSLDRLGDGWKKLKETMDDDEASGWEKMLSILNEIVQVMDTINSLTETFNTLTKISETLTKAKNAEELTGLAEQIGQLGAKNIAKGTEIALTKTATAAVGAENAVAVANTAAKSGEAVASATASGAKLPWPANLIAIAAGVGAVLAALASIKGFASGGIVGGGQRHGDRMLARLNSGEMILNENQQGRLWNAINHGDLGGGGNLNGQVKFVIRGSDLEGTLTNYRNKKRG